MAEYQPESELVLDDELLYDEAPRRSMLRRTGDRVEDIVREGEVLAGKYRVERIPGRNGLGVLVQVRHLELGQEVTLKFLVPEACAYPEFVQRFVREARSAVRIQGEHVARVTDVGRLESGAPYMVREYLRGPDLAEVLKVRGPLPIEEAVDYVIQACEGVAEGHALGVVHRNLRPTSLVLVRRSDGTALIKVFDFAASESLHVNPFTERSVSLVGTSAIMASLPYLAPEQIRDPHDVDFRADVYSLGAVLFELLTGTPVYAADAAPALLAQVAADAAPSVRTLRPDAPGDLDHLVLRCLAKNRAIRYASIADLAVALRPFASPDATSSVERIVRLGKRTSKLTEGSENRLPSALPPVPVAANLPLSQPPRGRHGTLLTHTAEPVASSSMPVRRVSMHEDVTTINPYAAYASPVVIHPESARSEPHRTEPMPHVVAREHRVDPPRTEMPRAEPLRQPARFTPPPPPLRSSAPPPLRDVPPPLPAVQTPLPAAANERPAARFETTAPPARRSSISGLSRSWAVPEEPSAPMFTQRRLIGMAAVAAVATLGVVLAVRGSHVAPVVAAAAPVTAAVKVQPAALPVAPPAAPIEPVAAASASAAVAAPAAPAAVVPPAAAPAPVVAAVAPAPVAPAPVAARAPVAVAAPVAPRPAPVARRPVPRDEPAVEAPRKAVAAVDKAPTRTTVAGDLFDDPR